ncbi:MAG TPA: hypothetical protein VKH19_10120 [Gemmatimonadaceae bacterium]|nr:hypothetical protein [Gemmatimonadaceae bacterium]
MTPGNMNTTAEMRARLNAIRMEKRGRVRWQITHHTAEIAIAAIAGHARVMYRPGSKSRRRKRHKRLL